MALSNYPSTNLFMPSNIPFVFILLHVLSSFTVLDLLLVEDCLLFDVFEYNWLMLLVQLSKFMVPTYSTHEQKKPIFFLAKQCE